MKTIRLSAKKLDRAADTYFEMVKTLESARTPHDTETLERMNLAGIALRRWACQMREERLRRWRRMRAGELTHHGDQYQHGKNWHDFATMNRRIGPKDICRTRRPLPAAFHAPNP